MEKFGYEYGATPRKLEPEYGPRKTKKSKEEFEKQIKINEKQKKEAMKMVAKDRGVGKRDIYQALL